MEDAPSGIRWRRFSAGNGPVAAVELTEEIDAGRSPVCSNLSMHHLQNADLFLLSILVSDGTAADSSGFSLGKIAGSERACLVVARYRCTAVSVCFVCSG